MNCPIKVLVALLIIIVSLIYSTAQAEISMKVFNHVLDTCFENSTNIVEIEEQNCINVNYGELKEYSYPFTIQLVLSSSMGGKKDSIQIRGITDFIIEDPIDAVILANIYNTKSNYTRAYVDNIGEKFYFTIDHFSYCSDSTSEEDIFYNIGYSLIEIHQFVDLLKSDGYEELNNIKVLPQEWEQGGQ